MSNNSKDPVFDDDSVDRDRTLKDELGETIDKEQLKYNAEDNSYEYDVKSDEANPYDTADEYIPNESLETDVDKLGMHIDDGKIVEIDPIDEVLSRTPEDDRDDLDEEGYPKNDRV
jgi:hypothetical protein